MHTRIKRWLAPPNFPSDDEKTAQARIINTTGLYFVLALIAGAAILVPFFVRYKIVSWAIILALGIMYAISRALLFRGHLSLSVGLMIASVWVMGIGVSILGGGIASPMLYIILADTIFIGFLLESRTGILLMFVSTLITLGLAVLQQNGVSPPQIFIFSPMATWFMFALTLWFVHAVMTRIKFTLGESERKFRSIADNIPGMVYRLRVRDDGSSYFSYVSPKVTELFDLPVDPHSINRELGVLAHPDDREPLLSSLCQAITNRTNWDYEWRILKRSGDIMWCRGISSSPEIRDELCFDGVILDITERKRTEKALRQAMDIVENVQVGLHIYHLEDIDNDHTLRMVYANPAAEEFTGVQVVDMVGKTLDENFPNMRQFDIPKIYADVARLQTHCELGDVFYGDERVRETAFSVKVFPLPDQHVGVSFEDITERKLAEEKLVNLARTDDLTGLNNRRYFFELAEQEVERANRYKHNLSCIMFDIDHFKEINDTYGHLFGDKVLQEIARCSQKNIRQIDILARYGGDEFVVLFPETDIVGVLDVTERLRKCLGMMVVGNDDVQIPLTLSVGIANLPTVDKPTLNDLLSHADQALYQSKEGGRDRVTVWQAN